MSWNQLAALLKAAQEDYAANKVETGVAEGQPPISCPICGWVLQVGSDGHTRNCPAGDYTWE